MSLTNSKNPKRQGRDVRLAPDLLETRQLLTGGAGSTFAIMPGSITTANQPVVVSFTVDPKHFTVPKGKFTLGIDVAGDSTTGSPITPVILGVQQSNGKAAPGTSHTIYDKSVRASGTVANALTSSVTMPVTLSGKAHNGPVTYSVVISANASATGKFLLGFYLPGDADGSGLVDKTDIAKIKSSLNAKAASTKYSFDADADRNGRIDATDLAIAKRNMGVKTTISPSVSALLDPTNGVALASRVTAVPSAYFTGQLSPDAAITFTEIDGKVPSVSTTADATGNYNLTTALASGSNTFRVTTKDAFGQSISGTIAAVNYLSPTTVAAASATTPAATTTTPASTTTTTTTPTTTTITTVADTASTSSSAWVNQPAKTVS